MGFDSVRIPSIELPIFSNSVLISHMIQCEMPFKRNAKLTAIAMAPTDTIESDQRYKDTAATEKVSK